MTELELCDRTLKVGCVHLTAIVNDLDRMRQIVEDEALREETENARASILAAERSLITAIGRVEYLKGERKDAGDSVPV